MTYLEQMQDFYVNSPETCAIYEALEKQTERVAAQLDDNLAQLCLSTATKAMPLWEKAYGLTPDEGKEYKYRRERVMSRMRGQGKATNVLIKNVAESFTNGAVEIEEYPAISRFILRFVGSDGIPPNVGDLAEAIELIKPAHLGFGFMYTYASHDELRAYQHNQLAVMAHDQIRRPENVRSY